jgi:hypothetical protein
MSEESNIDGMLRAIVDMTVQQIQGQVVAIEPMLDPNLAQTSPALMFRDFRIELGLQVKDKLHEVIEKSWQAQRRPTQSVRPIRHTMPQRRS